MDKGSIFILSYFKTLNIGPVPEIEPVLQASAPNNWVNPAAVREILPFTCDAFRVSWRVYRSLSCWGASGDRDIVSSSQYRLTLVGAHWARFYGHKITRGECEERPPPFSPPHSTHTLSWEHRFNRGFKLDTYTVNIWSSEVNNPKILAFVFGNFSVTLENMNSTLKTQFFAYFLSSILIDR